LLVNSDQGILNRITASDEIWCYSFSPQSKYHASQEVSKEDVLCKPFKGEGGAKVLFDRQKFIHHGFILEKHVMSKTMYKDIPHHLQEAVHYTCLHLRNVLIVVFWYKSI
jgi:hypothetical protein